MRSTCSPPLRWVPARQKDATGSLRDPQTKVFRKRFSRKRFLWELRQFLDEKEQKKKQKCHELKDKAFEEFSFTKCLVWVKRCVACTLSRAPFVTAKERVLKRNLPRFFSSPSSKAFTYRTQPHIKQGNKGQHYPNLRWWTEYAVKAKRITPSW